MECIYPKDQKTNGGKQCNSSSRECKTIRERKQNVLPALSIIQGLELSKKQTRLVLQFCLSFKYRNRSRVSIISGPWDDLSPELGINQVTSPGLTQPQLSMICSYYWMEERKLCCVTTRQTGSSQSRLQHASDFFFPLKKKIILSRTAKTCSALPPQQQQLSAFTIHHGKKFHFTSFPTSSFAELLPTSQLEPRPGSSCRGGQALLSLTQKWRCSVAAEDREVQRLQAATYLAVLDEGETCSGKHIKEN